MGGQRGGEERGDRGRGGGREDRGMTCGGEE